MHEYGDYLLEWEARHVVKVEKLKEQARDAYEADVKKRECAACISPRCPDDSGTCINNDDTVPCPCWRPNRFEEDYWPVWIEKWDEAHDEAQLKQDAGDYGKEAALEETELEDKMPETLEECFEILTKMTGKKNLDVFKKTGEDTALAGIHFSGGMWIRNNWGLWGQKGKLYKYFKGLGLFHPDDMSSIILRSFHRHLNKKPLNVEEQVKSYLEYWDRQDNEQ